MRPPRQVSAAQSLDPLSSLNGQPLVGDLFDAWWKSNQMNVELLRKRGMVSASEAKQGRISDWLFVGLIILALVCLLAGTVFLTIYSLTLFAGRITGTLSQETPIRF